MNRLRIYTLLLSLFLVGFSTNAQSKKQKDLEEKRQSILKEIKQINSLLFNTRGKKKSVLAEVEDLNQRISARQNLIRITNQQANLLTREIKENENSISELKTELTDLKEDYASMINKSFKSKSQQSRMMFLLSSENFLQAYKRMQYMKQYTNHRKMQGESIKSKTVELQGLNESLVKQNEDKKKLIAENRVAKSKLDKEKLEQVALVKELKKDENSFVSSIRKKQKAANELDKQIDKMIRDAILANNKTVKSTGVKKTGKASTFTLTPEAKAIARNFKSNKGKLIWPLEKGRILNRFGKRRHPQFPNVTQNFNGVEILTESNATVRAVFNGVVMQVQQIKGANKAVYVRHGDYISIYGNLASVSVKAGDKITTKQNLGTVFTHPTTGRSLLKFFIFQNATKLNPADWVYKM